MPPACSSPALLRAWAAEPGGNGNPGDHGISVNHLSQEQPSTGLCKRHVVEHTPAYKTCPSLTDRHRDVDLNFMRIKAENKKEASKPLGTFFLVAAQVLKGQSQAPPFTADII